MDMSAITSQNTSRSYKVQLTTAFVKLRRLNPLSMSLAFKMQTWRPRRARHLQRCFSHTGQLLQSLDEAYARLMLTIAQQ